MSIFAVFDLDGTLLDTIVDLADACNYALKKQGFPVHPVNPYKYFVGMGVYNLIKKALPEEARSEEIIAAVKADYDSYYSVHSRDKTAPYSGIVEALAALRERGVRLAVLSNKPHEYIKPLTDLYFPGIFDISVGQRENVPTKPDPTAVFEIMESFGAKKDAGFYIGDTSTDMRTGKSAGLYTIGVLWGFRTKDELESHGADVIIAEPSELLKIIVDK
ncbi:phosphoglycolate phosphatase [Clostridia bacterium]|nr:phosphoglycolate phosphatase [Clostridia bacterium]